MTRLHPSEYEDIVRRALAEDIGTGDITTSATVSADVVARAAIVSKGSYVIAGLDVALETFRQVDAKITVDVAICDGQEATRGQAVATMQGRGDAILSAERTALNFLQHLSGIATLTRRYVAAAAGRVAILDTRKTIPTLRALAKYAVRCGGGLNHRTGLFDAILIKDNHIRLAGGIEAAIARARERWPGRTVEVETQSLAEVREAVRSGADVIMLDNQSHEEMREAVAIVGGRANVEISGGVSLADIPALATLGATWISVGALTHSAPAADFSLEFEARGSH